MRARDRRALPLVAGRVRVRVSASAVQEGTSHAAGCCFWRITLLPVFKYILLPQVIDNTTVALSKTINLIPTPCPPWLPRPLRPPLQRPWRTGRMASTYSSHPSLVWAFPGLSTSLFSPTRAYATSCVQFMRAFLQTLTPIWSSPQLRTSFCAHRTKNPFKNFFRTTRQLSSLYASVPDYVVARAALVLSCVPLEVA